MDAPVGERRDGSAGIEHAAKHGIVRRRDIGKRTVFVVTYFIITDLSPASSELQVAQPLHAVFQECFFRDPPSGSH